jgi:hypothetical protein
MKKEEKVTRRKTSKVEIDRTLNEFHGKILFKSTLEKAQEAFKNLKLPEKQSVRR